MFSGTDRLPPLAKTWTPMFKYPSPCQNRSQIPWRTNGYAKHHNFFPRDKTQSFLFLFAFLSKFPITKIIVSNNNLPFKMD